MARAFINMRAYFKTTDQRKRGENAARQRYAPSEFQCSRDKKLLITDVIEIPATAYTFLLSNWSRASSTMLIST